MNATQTELQSVRAALESANTCLIEDSAGPARLSSLQVLNLAEPLVDDLKEAGWVNVRIPIVKSKKNTDKLPQGLTAPLPRVLTQSMVDLINDCHHVAKSHNRVLQHFRNLHTDLKDVIEGNIISESKLHDLLIEIGHKPK